MHRYIIGIAAALGVGTLVGMLLSLFGLDPKPVQILGACCIGMSVTLIIFLLAGPFPFWRWMIGGSVLFALYAGALLPIAAFQTVRGNNNTLFWYFAGISAVASFFSYLEAKGERPRQSG